MLSVSYGLEEKQLNMLEAIIGERGRIDMCGLFGFTLRTSIPFGKAVETLRRLETHQYPNELRPVGGYGAGIAVVLEDGSVLIEKVGKIGNSPVQELAETVDVKKASILLGHVRMPSPEFMDSAIYRETAQPYVVQQDPGLTVVSVHNGMMENYKEVRERFGTSRVFESEKHQLIDSEVVPRYFEEILSEKLDVPEALFTFFCSMRGPNTVGMLQLSEENSYLHLVHKGRTRGLIVWTNERGEVIFCSRRTPLVEGFGSFLSRGGFKEKASILHTEVAGLILSYPLGQRQRIQRSRSLRLGGR